MIVGVFAVGFDQEMVNYLPSYAAAAAYHHRLASQPADISAFLKEVRDWARGPYAMALAKGQDLSDADRRDIAKLIEYPENTAGAAPWTALRLRTPNAWALARIRW